MTVLLGRNIPRGDIISQSSMTFTQCCNLCLSTINCRGFSWIWSNHTNP
ncbi:unnamed protein product, partial [Adineta ricciae]